MHSENLCVGILFFLIVTEVLCLIVKLLSFRTTFISGGASLLWLLTVNGLQVCAI